MKSTDLSINMSYFNLKKISKFYFSIEWMNLLFVCFTETETDSEIDHDLLTQKEYSFTYALHIYCVFIRVQLILNYWAILINEDEIIRINQIINKCSVIIKKEFKSNSFSNDLKNKTSDFMIDNSFLKVNLIYKHKIFV